MVPLKRRKLLSSQSGNNGNTGTDVIAVKAPVKFPDVVLFLLERKMGASRRAFLSQLAAKNGFHVQETFSGMVTHVISEGNSGAEVGSWLDSQTDGLTHRPVHLLGMSWFTQSMKAGRPIDITDTHRLQKQQVDESEVEVFSVPSFACQRRTTLENHNTVLTDALSLLAEMAELSAEEGRGVAFRRACAVLKCLKEPVTGMSQLRGLPCLGEHSLRVIQDILVNGASSEAESTKCSERFKALKLLTGIFGVGCKTADRWIREGILSLQQLTDSAHSLNRAQQAGVDHYDDLNQPVTKAEADSISVIVEEALVTVLPGATMTLIGGFRRGKQTGHDVDFLITHPEEGAEVGLMPKVVSWLQSQGFLLYQKTTRNSYLEAKDGPARPASNMDRFERCFSIFKLDKQGPGLQSHTQRATDGEGSHFGSAVDSVCEPENGQIDGSHFGSAVDSVCEPENGQIKQWRAVRVDLVVSPISQFPFALLGWTGSKLFERELRRWAGHEKSMSLSSHALYDSTQRKYLRATSEEEIFTHLGLEFIPPSDRNA